MARVEAIIEQTKGLEPEEFLDLDPHRDHFSCRPPNRFQGFSGHCIVGRRLCAAQSRRNKLIRF
jgi:hypothetical protein